VANLLNAQKTIRVAILFLLFTVLSASLNIYSEIQQGITLEGNRLHSAHALLITDSSDQVLSSLTTENVNARVYRSLSPDGRIRAILELGNNSTFLPIHDGRQFSANDVQAAMVGSDVPVQTVEGESFYEYQGTQYLVVATLGFGERSLLSEDVLIRDRALFSPGVLETVVVDGAEAESQIMREFGEDAYAQLASATGRRTNIDYVSPILLGFGWSLVSLGCVIAALLMARYTRPLDTVRHQLGHTRWWILRSDLFKVTTISLVSSAPASILVLMMARAPETAGVAIAAILAQAILIVVLSGIVISYRIWSQR